MTKTEIDFLRESNAIERVYDTQSLDQAAVAWKFLKAKSSLTVGDILKIHKILMLHQPLFPNEKGYFRTCDVWIGGKRKKFLHESIFREKLESLIKDMHRKYNGDSEGWAQKLHVLFEDIHPFVDGNGRVGRMLYNWHRLRLGLPLHVIHEGDEQMEYYQWFR